MKTAVTLLLFLQVFFGYAIEQSNAAAVQNACLEFFQRGSAKRIFDSQNELRNALLESLYEKSPRIADLIAAPNNRFSNSELAKAVSEKVAKKWWVFNVKDTLRGSVEQHGSKLVITIGHLLVNSDLKYGESPMGLGLSFINVIAGVIDGVLIRASKNKKIKSVEIVAYSVIHPGLKQLLITSGFKFYHSQSLYDMGSSFGLEIKLR